VWSRRRQGNGRRHLTRRWIERRWCARSRFSGWIEGDVERARPGAQNRQQGITWHYGATAGQSIPLSRLYIANPDKDTAASINAQLDYGKNLLLTPGIYQLEDAIHVTRPDTVVLGLGFATLKATRGSAALTTADLDGIDIAGLIIDAGPVKSQVLLEVGPPGSKARHAANPICLHDVFFRDGGAGADSTEVNLRINSSDTIVDDTWIWRADHGSGVGWDSNRSARPGGEWRQRDHVWPVC